MEKEVKELLITQCPDPLMWYAGKIGHRVPYLGERYGTYTSREDDGWTNIVKMEDAEIINNDDMEELKNCTRVEVIDEKGRSYVNWHPDNIVKIDMQDDGRTMKVFIVRKDSE